MGPRSIVGPGHYDTGGEPIREPWLMSYPLALEYKIITCDILGYSNALTLDSLIVNKINVHGIILFGYSKSLSVQSI